MIVIEKETKKKREDIINIAKSYFGPEGEGLETTREEDCCVSFEGGGGHVSVRYIDTDTGKSKVEVESREFEHQAKQFLGKV